jgi:hypothetical protein
LLSLRDRTDALGGVPTPQRQHADGAEEERDRPHHRRLRPALARVPPGVRVRVRDDRRHAPVAPRVPHHGGQVGREVLGGAVPVPGHDPPPSPVGRRGAPAGDRPPVERWAPRAGEPGGPVGAALALAALAHRRPGRERARPADAPPRHHSGKVPAVEGGPRPSAANGRPAAPRPLRLPSARGRLVRSSAGLIARVAHPIARASRAWGERGSVRRSRLSASCSRPGRKRVTWDGIGRAFRRIPPVTASAITAAAVAVPIAATPRRPKARATWRATPRVGRERRGATEETAGGDGAARPRVLDRGVSSQPARRDQRLTAPRTSCP